MGGAIEKEGEKPITVKRKLENEFPVGLYTSQKMYSNFATHFLIQADLLH